MKQTLLVSVTATFVIFLLGGFPNFGFTQCGINDVNFTPDNLTLCETGIPIDFSANIDVDSDTIPIPGSPVTNNFQLPFDYDFATENNGCTYALRISGTYSLWGNPDEMVDARYRFDPLTNDELNQTAPAGLTITPPLYFTPETYNPNHEYWFFYEGDGNNIHIDFEDSGQYNDNSGDMMFEWFVLSCYDTLWTIDGIDFNGSNDRSFSWQTPGSFDVTLTVTDILDGCSDSAAGQINISRRPEVSIQTTDACPNTNDGSATAILAPGTGTAPIQFNWSDGSPDAAFAENIAPGNHQIIVTDANDCRDTADFSIIEKSQLNLLLDFTDPTCEGLDDGFIELLNPASAWTFSLNGTDFQPNPIFQNLNTGDFTFHVNDGTGCIFTEPASLSTPASFQVELPDEITVNENEIFTISSAVSDTGNFKYTWLPSDGLDCSDCAEPNAQLNDSQSYTLTVFDEDGCSAADTVFVRVLKIELPDDTGIFVPTAFSPNNDGINDFLTVFADRKIITQIVNLSVYDRYGGLIFQKTNFEPNNEMLGWSGQGDGKVLNPGIYAWFAELERTDGTTTIVKGEVSLVK